MKWINRNGVWTIGGKTPVRTAPIQVDRRQDAVPYEVAAEAYKEYARQFGTDQSLDRLNERGGFAATELAILLYERIQSQTDEWRAALRRSHLTFNAVTFDLLDPTNAPPKHADCADLRRLWHPDFDG